MWLKGALKFIHYWILNIILYSNLPRLYHLSSGGKKIKCLASTGGQFYQTPHLDTKKGFQGAWPSDPKGGH